MKNILIVPAMMATLVHGLPAMAQEDKPVTETTLERQMPAEVTQGPHDNIMTLVVENDMLGQGTDRDYTSGIRLTYLDVDSVIPGFARTLDEHIPVFNINETTRIFYSLGQNIFTPDDIQRRTQDPNDRPWAAFLYASVGMVTLSDNHTDEIEATIGVVGPAALGEQTQKLIHTHLTDSPTPRGWGNQLDNEPALMLAWNRTWPQYVSGTIGPLFGSISPYYGATVGNVYTYGNAGLMFRLGPETDKWQDVPARVRPAMPGTGYFDIPKDHWSWYLFAGLEGRVVARNIFLDGNTFKDSHDVDKKILVGDINAGIAFTYDQLRIAYTYTHRTKEFETQDDAVGFGAVSIGYRF